MDPITGSLEIITGTPPNDTSVGVPVAAATPALVPTIVQALYGITGLVAGTPTDDHQVALWTGQDAQFRPVKVILWKEPKFDDTLIGKMLAQATQEGGAE